MVYGAAPNETAMLNALSAVDAQVYSLGESVCSGATIGTCGGGSGHAGVEEGKPATFGFAFILPGPPACTISGGPDPEVLDGTAGDDVICGGGGADTIRGGGGDDIMLGGGGGDRLSGGRGADEFSGGDGRDTVAYSQRTADLALSIGDGANDGEVDEADTIDSDVEDMRGGAGADQLTGNAGDNKLVGGDGADQLTGGLGNDRLVGEAGDDHLDALDGAGFVDSLICGDGAADTALADAEDVVGADCEVEPAPTSRSTRLTPRCADPTAVWLASSRARRSRRRRSRRRGPGRRRRPRACSSPPGACRTPP